VSGTQVEPQFMLARLGQGLGTDAECFGFRCAPRTTQTWSYQGQCVGF
jgi:hypothetical protein